MRTCAFIRTSLALLVSAILISCGNGRAKYVIGVSQCSEDSWRQKLKEELEMATFFNDRVKLVFTCANDDSRLQERQIDSLVQSGVDLLIVSPNQVDLLSDEIDRAYDAGIPVILFDRKTDSPKYTAFMGADNFQIGEMLGHYIAAKTGDKGNVVEIGGLDGSSPAQERHDGFVHAMKRHPNIRIAGYGIGDWTEESGVSAMKEILENYDGEIDVVFGGNDRMAAGAKKAMQRAGRDCRKTLFVGVDALPTDDGGIRMVEDGILTASAIYPTHGDELMLLAIDILEGRPFKRETTMISSVVTEDNAPILLLQHEEVMRQAKYLKTMHLQAGKMHESIRLQQIIIGLVLLFALIITSLLSFYVRAYRQKHILNSQLQEEKEKVERQRDELEEQRDRLIELSLTGQTDDELQKNSEQQSRKDNDFMMKFCNAVERSLSNPDLSVEDISTELCMSRAQLYRRVKALTGKSPVEIIRQMRLAKADKLLSDSSLNVSEIAYRVGFSSSSYFSKCYRDQFGKLPTDVNKPNK